MVLCQMERWTPGCRPSPAGSEDQRALGREPNVMPVALPPSRLERMKQSLPLLSRRSLALRESQSLDWNVEVACQYIGLRFLLRRRAIGRTSGGGYECPAIDHVGCQGRALGQGHAAGFISTNVGSSGWKQNRIISAVGTGCAAG